MKTIVVGLVAALMTLGVSAQRVDTVLSDGWIANGVAVTLPHTWNAVDAADGPAEGETDCGGSVRSAGYLRQAVTYRHALPAADKTRRRFVRCEAASITAVVIVNGRVVGRHSGAMTAFAFEITKELRTTNNVLEIVVDNYYDPDSTPLSGDFSMPGGLYRPVHLIETPAICFDPIGEGSGPGLEVAADPKTGRVCVTPQVSYAAGTETNAVRLSYEVVETGCRSEASSFVVKGFRLWTPETPVVYHLRATLESALGKDVVTLPFGFVRHELRADGYYLNGKKRKLRGVNFHQDVEGKGWALSPADEWQSVEMVKKIGADAVRTAHYPQSSGIYDLCDTRGLVAWIELPVVDEVGTNAAFRAHARQNLVEMIAQNRHHPSVAFWSIANEVHASRTEGGESALLSVLTELRDTALAADATRPVVQANYQPGQTNVNALTGHFGLNTYPGWYWSTADGLQRDIDRFFTRNPKLTTIAVSEYGAGASIAQHENPAPIKCRDPNGGWHPEEYQTLHHVLQYAVIKRDPRVWGSFVWQMFDSAADVRTDGPIPGINDKGLVCRDHRTPKDAFFFYKANWNPEPMLHLCGQRMTATTNAVAEVMAFSNAGDVTLVVNGKTVGTKSPDEVKTVRWQGVTLVPGENRIEVTAGGRKVSCRWTLGPVAAAGKPTRAFSTLRLPATRESWPAHRAMLSRSRDCFDEIWFSACNFKSLAENAEKAKWLGEVAREVREMGYIASLEFELTIGNTDTPDCKRLPFKDWTGFTGPEGWEGVNCNCPRDPRFHAYFREQLKYYGAWAPTVIWLDDDVRVDNHGNNSTGCFCARCLAAFSKQEGKTWAREALVAAMKTDAALAARWREHCFKGLGEFAYAFCRAAKEFSPTSRLGLQYPWADEGQLHIIEAMVKATGEPIEMRPGCCSYYDRDPFNQIDKTYRMQCQVKTLLAHPDWYSRLCPEIETYPRTFTTRTARSLGFEALMHLASGLDSLTWYIAGNAEQPELYEGTTFRAPRENLALYREYVRRNAGAVQVGFGAPEWETFGKDIKGFAAVNGSSTIPYAFGVARKLGTVLWREDQVADADEASLRKMLSGAVLATRAATAALVSRGLVPSDAATLPSEMYTDSTAYFPKAVKTPEGGQLVVYPSLDPMGATVKTLLEYAHLADTACGGRFPILFEDPALAVVLPRVFADGSFASAVIVNTRIEEQAPVRLRLRNFTADAALWFPLWAKGPVRLPVMREAKTGDALVMLPAVGAWSSGFLVPEVQDCAAANWQRLAAFGFDDFRESDFALVEPIFAAHGATATYNRPANAAAFSADDIARMSKLEAAGNEIGDHTWKHWNVPFDDPLMNGQDPAAPEGGQTPFPSNAQLRDDRGDGCNAFGFPLTDSVDVQLSDFFAYGSKRWSAFDAPWGKLTDAQCHTIRSYFAVYGNPLGILDLFDELSNRYLGTKGRSRGSWDAAKGCYTGGIFTGCRTSANHEIWERILELTRAAYRAQVRGDFAFSTWSWPGSIPSPFLFRRDGRAYHDAAYTLPANAMARFMSTRLKGADGAPLRRSWTEALRAAGYETTHDMTFPSRRDGTPETMMRRQLFRNASLSRRDALGYSTDRTVHYLNTAREFSAGAKPAAMYDAGGSYRDFVEAARHDTARGLVHGEVIDSENTPSEAAFLNAALDYCRAAGIRVVSKREAFRRSFGSVQTAGNLLLNAAYRNTAAEFLSEAKTVPGNPDGYTGACWVKMDDAGVRTLVTTGRAETVVYGVPLGKLRYSASVRGRGKISVRAIRNRTAADLRDSETLAEFSVDGGDFEAYAVQLTVPEAPETAYEPRWEGLGDKIMGLQIVYPAGLEIRDERMENIELTNRKIM